LDKVLFLLETSRKFLLKQYFIQSALGVKALVSAWGSRLSVQ